jgi:hypothetical protein
MARPPLACVFRLSLAAVLVYLRRVSGMTAPMSLKAKRAGHRVHGGDVPSGSDRAILAAACPAETRASPFSVASTASTTRSGSFDRFASVSFRIFAPSR